jgi:hypothetical protein
MRNMVCFIQNHHYHPPSHRNRMTRGAKYILTALVDCGIAGGFLYHYQVL